MTYSPEPALSPGAVSLSAVASHLIAQIARAETECPPVVIVAQDRATGVRLSVDHYAAVVALVALMRSACGTVARDHRAAAVRSLEEDDDAA